MVPLDHHASSGMHGQYADTVVAYPTELSLSSYFR
jgi:hypothetical protein